MKRNTYSILTNERLQAEVASLKNFIGLQDQEIARQIQAKKLAQQTRNWTIILTILILSLVWIF